MKNHFLIPVLFTLLLCGCQPNKSSSMTSSGGTTTVDLDLSNFERYISYSKYEGYTGASGFSPYMAWLEFNGLLPIGVYDVTVTYKVDSTSYNLRLDVSGGGKTDYFDRNANYSISKVSGTVSYRL